ncbi:hypothetical protein DFH08DRAFT_820421 [Mycena albidolilacea]|uniref:DUF6532 domain-containing protein n=1 Tax=Mycena albidolilacea TaxID=1033008 RepID=A0AAD6ZC04_9AGAR|nr:hypothetical protein DFH08DRAFT_820421 [Mycena albidolilacea]
MPAVFPLYSQNDHNQAYATNIPQNRTNLLYAPPSRNWDVAVAHKQLYKMQDVDDYDDDNDEDFGSYWSSSQTVDVEGTDASASPIDAMPLAFPSTSDTSVDIRKICMSSPRQTHRLIRTNPTATLQISSSPVTALVPCKRKVGSIDDLVVPAASSSPTAAVASRRPQLVRRTNIFGPGLHDNRQRPLTPSSASGNMGGKENEMAEPSSDDVDNLVNPVPKKSRKTRGARSIRSIQHENPIRAKALEAGYEYIRRKVWTDEEATWTERREAVAILAQDALDYGFGKLGLDPSNFTPVTDKEQDLMRERIYGSCKILKYAAREIVKGANGYGFVQCANNATPEVIESTGAQNRAIVATLLHKQGLVFLDPSDRTLRGSMFKHPAIQAMAEATVFKNVLADAIQHPEWFDDAPPPPDDDTAAHKPQFSAVFLNLLICALRGAISGWSSGHWVKESFSRKVYHSHFVSDLKTFRDWEKYTSNPTVLTGHGPTRKLLASYLTRTLQESITENTRFKVFKDIVAPVPANEVLDTSDFSLNQ